MHVTDWSDPNWWKGRNSRGEGLFPANFVTAEASPPASARASPPPSADAVETSGVTRADSPLLLLDEARMDAALAALHEADPARAGPDEARLQAHEARALAMGALVDAALERADTRHARLTQLSAELVDALNLYHELMRDPHPHPQPHPRALYPLQR